jgi:hypothetical protein
MTPEVVAWLVAAMSAWVPPGANDAVRYDAIARDILSVAFDPEEAPLYDEANGRARTALVLASFAAAESGGFLLDVDTGKRRGGNGAVCMMQVKVGPHGTSEGWSAKDLVENRSRCVRVGLHMMRESVQTCHAMKGADRLSFYTHGRCVADNGVARWRVGRADGWLKRNPMP